jgi:hypothetical protein
MGGHGGDGSPPGTAGRKGRITPEFGRGGTGGGMIGAPGELLGREFQTSDPMEGTLCGDTLQCTCNSESTDGSAWATSPFQARGASCENCCPGRCSSTSPPNTGIRVLRFTDVFVGDGFSVTTQVTAFYDACGQRDEFGNCREKFTFTCVAYGMGFECTSAYTGIVAGLEGRTLLAGHAFCHGVGNLCVGDGRACSLTFSGDGMSSTRTWQCTNCGDYGPSCASEQSASCRCLNFDRTGPGLLLVCDTCFGESCE